MFLDETVALSYKPMALDCRYCSPYPGVFAMDTDALMGRYSRLKQDLAAAYRELPWRSGLIDRIANELAETERALTLTQRRPGRPAEAAMRSSA
jgi:hypothetical protein